MYVGYVPTWILTYLGTYTHTYNIKLGLLMYDHTVIEKICTKHYQKFENVHLC